MALNEKAERSARVKVYFIKSVKQLHRRLINNVYSALSAIRELQYHWERIWSDRSH